MQKQTSLEKKVKNNQKEVFKNRQNARKIYFQKILNIRQICIFGDSKPQER